MFTLSKRESRLQTLPCLKENKMAKSFGAKPYLFPMPTYMIGTYNEDGTADVMMMA